MANLGHIAVLGLLLFATACGDDNASGNSNTSISPTPTPSATPTPIAPATPTIDQQIATLEAGGRLPKLDRSNSLTGPDTNGNGVRDDVEAYIASRPITDGQKRAELQLSRAFQATMTVAIDNRSSVDSVGLLFVRAIHCIYDQFPEGKQVTSAAGALLDIEQATLNTKARVVRHFSWNDASDGSVDHWPEGNTCD